MGMGAWFKRALDSGGARIASGTVWEVPGINDATLFLRALPELFPSSAVLVLEGRPPRDISAYLEGKAPDVTTKVASGTIWPPSLVFHMQLTARNIEGLASLAERHAAFKIADHVHVYQDGVILLDWYDAFYDDPFLLSKNLNAEAIARFCERLGVSHSETTA